MRLLEKWTNDSNEQEKQAIRKRLYSCFHCIDPQNESYPFLQKAIDCLIRQNILEYKGVPFLQVVPLVFINHHRFYNNEICEFLKEYVNGCKMNKQELNSCFCLFGILFFMYAGCDVSSSLDMLDDVVKKGVEQKLFDDVQISKKFRNNDLNSLVNMQNDTEYVLASTLWIFENEKRRCEAERFFSRNLSDILLLYDVFNGLMKGNDNLDYASVEKNHILLKDFFNFCIKACIG